MRRKWMYLAPLALLAGALLVALGGEAVKLLWNWLLPPIVGWRAVTFWEAVGILALCRILFGGIGPHRSAGGRVRRRMAERWEAMSPEERERLRQSARGRCGFGPSSPEPQG